MEQQTLFTPEAIASVAPLLDSPPSSLRVVYGSKHIHIVVVHREQTMTSIISCVEASFPGAEVTVFNDTISVRNHGKLVNMNSIDSRDAFMTSFYAIPGVSRKHFIPDTRLVNGESLGLSC